MSTVGQDACTKYAIVWSWVYLIMGVPGCQTNIIESCQFTLRNCAPISVFFLVFALFIMFSDCRTKSGLAISTWLPKNTLPSGQACFAKPWLHTDKFANLAGFSLRKITGNPKKGILAKKAADLVQNSVKRWVSTIQNEVEMRWINNGQILF